MINAIYFDALKAGFSILNLGLKRKREKESKEFDRWPLYYKYMTDIDIKDVIARVPSSCPPALRFFSHIFPVHLQLSYEESPYVYTMSRTLQIQMVTQLLVSVKSNIEHFFFFINSSALEFLPSLNIWTNNQIKNNFNTYIGSVNLFEKCKWFLFWHKQCRYKGIKCVDDTHEGHQRGVEKKEREKGGLGRKDPRFVGREACANERH